MQNDKSIQMNKREMMAMHILAGLVSDRRNIETLGLIGETGHPVAGSAETAAEVAVGFADALIKALRKRPEPKPKPDEEDY